MRTTLVAGAARALNWRRGRADVRDVDLSRAAVGGRALPTSATTRARARPAIRDQGHLGTCTQNAGAAAMAFVHMVTVGAQGDPLFSRLFGYWFTRQLETDPTALDTGCDVRNVFKAYRAHGLCFETTWPYDETRYQDEPSSAAVAEGARHRAVRYYSCRTLAAVKRSISDGWPVIFGFDCYDSIHDATPLGLIPYPRGGDRPIGGHCVLADSYDEHERVVGFQNSWGPGWGAGGYGSLPMSYFDDGLASDAWTLRVEQTDTKFDFGGPP